MFIKILTDHETSSESSAMVSSPKENLKRMHALLHARLAEEPRLAT